MLQDFPNFWNKKTEDDFFFIKAYMMFLTQIKHLLVMDFPRGMLNCAEEWATVTYQI